LAIEGFRVKAIVGGEAKVDRSFGLEILIIFEFGARI